MAVRVLRSFCHMQQLFYLNIDQGKSSPDLTTYEFFLVVQYGEIGRSIRSLVYNLSNYDQFSQPNNKSIIS